MKSSTKRKKKRSKSPMLTHKIRIHPDPDQEGVLWDLSEKCRLIYNFAVKERRDNWGENKDKPKKQRKFISYQDQQNKLPETKEKYPEYKWVYSKVLQMVLKKLDADYKSFFALQEIEDQNARPPGFKSSRWFTTLCYNQSGFKIISDWIEFSHKHPSGTELKFKLNHHLRQ